MLLAHGAHSLLYAIPAFAFVVGLAALAVRDRRRSKQRRPGWKAQEVRERARARRQARRPKKR